ncbi:hypothetical protein AJ80_02482 [Polytolypa hystricis UAMH7299]|uniref:Up-regulated during septation protein 1 domain-containing protein n=1 Tax=Polytolypa hystricis (strain UAMH7299) TaxID=1447883 RepID=A0A2B7YRM0_POLH7|nr:hypothetical protein AJ80_02482 [Polytolypa hystricis UAMH7299]
MMIAVEQKVHDLAVHVGLNNIIARDTAATQPIHRDQIALNGGSSGRQTPTEKPKYQLWPSLKKTTSLSAMRTPDITEMVKKNQSNQGNLSRRRKISVPELGPMTTVHEKHMDSPTIPGRFPIHERSNSAPGTSWSRGNFEGPELPPVGEPTVSSRDSFGRLLDSATSQDEHWSLLKRTSSLITLPDSIFERPLNTARSECANNGHIQFGGPPAVPPKSPRLALKIPPNQLQASTYYNSGSSPSTTTLMSGPGSAPVNSTNSDGFIFPAKESQPQTSAPIERMVSPPPWFSSTSGKHSRGHSRNRSIGLAQAPVFTSEVTRKPKGHHRDPSQDSVMNRGRPVKKSLAIEDPSRNHIDDAYSSLPSGLAPEKASEVLSYSEVTRLQDQARKQAQKFEVLKYGEVKSLSRELRALDKRCEYLRETYNSLRAGRRSLHTRMISYLRSPRVSKFSREGILKQEEALSELDQSIDEWVTKLELAENRRTRIRQKLLEHMAGAMILRYPPAVTDPFLDHQTPPRSPLKTDSPASINRRDVESIRIYAGAELQALFVNIEKEMERMVDHGHSASPTPALVESF